jgi:transposase
MKSYKNFLKPEERTKLLILHRAENSSRYADRIKVILWLDKGLSFKKISELLFLDDQTARNYLERFESGGSDTLIDDNYTGYTGKLNKTQQQELAEHIKQNIYLDVKPIIEYVKSVYRVKYSRCLLHKLGFVYKKTSHVPGKADKDKQEEFIKRFETFMTDKSSDTPVFFMYASHPQFNSMLSYGWIYKGDRVEVPSNTGRERINLNGAVNAETHEAVVLDCATVNADATIELFKELEYRYPSAPSIHVFSDNAKYYHSRKVKEFLENSKINLWKLPPYSPNLNIIERLWKFFHKKVLYNKYYETFLEFKSECLMFFETLSDHKDKLKSLLTLNFQLFSDKSKRLYSY